MPTLAAGPSGKYRAAGNRRSAGVAVNSFTESAAAARRPGSAREAGVGPFALYNRTVQTTL